MRLSFFTALVAGCIAATSSAIAVPEETSLSLADHETQLAFA